MKQPLTSVNLLLTGRERRDAAPAHWNSNQFRLPFWKTTKRSCTPEAPEALAMTVVQVCQQPVLGMVACAISGPVGLPAWNSIVPVPPLLFATRTAT